MIVKLLTEPHLECLSLKGDGRGSSESTHVKMPHCWKSHALAQIYYFEKRSADDSKSMKNYQARKELMQVGICCCFLGK